MTRTVLLAAVLATPATVAAYLLGGHAAAPLLAAGAGQVVPPAGHAPGTAALVLGTLHTRGLVHVEWQGVRIPIDGGSYAYTGGEMIGVTEGAMAVLDLGGAGQLYFCPGATARLDRADAAYRLHVLRGQGRFAFRDGTGFEVLAGGTRITPGAGEAPAQGSGPAWVGDVETRGDSRGSVLCELRGNLEVAADVGGDGAGEAGGRVVQVSSGDGVPRATVLPLPDEFMADIASALGASPAEQAAGGFLCRCGELLEYARRAREIVLAEQRAAEDATAQAETAPAEDAPARAPPATRQTPPPPAIARVDPPDLPPPTVAAPQPADLFDPDVLPPPAAGPVPVPLVVPPPLAPFAGGGTAGIVSES